ncbi:MAG: GSCFA domain-containing protein [Verrucomicrobiota bacterium]
MENPYSGLKNDAFWRTGVADDFAPLEAIYTKKFHLNPKDKIAAAGSCFAQHISRRLRSEGFNVLDKEPPPHLMPEIDFPRFGYRQYSARYGNIYTAQQLLQLAKEAFGDIKIELPVWSKDDRFFDALRPGIETEGHASHQDVIDFRHHHLNKVRELFMDMDILIFTLGLTEHWFDREIGAVLPIAPGTIAGEYDPSRHEFRNAAFFEVYQDFNSFQNYLFEKRDGRTFKSILTVSPVPLTATYEDRHVLVSTVESKSILRAVAGQIAREQARVDYFPSFEIVNHPAAHSENFEKNLRSVRPEAVSRVMSVFFGQHAVNQPSTIETRSSLISASGNEFVNCEEEVLESFNNA